MIEVKIEYKPVLDAIKSSASTLGTNRKALMRDISGIMYRSTMDNFQEEGRPKWRDLSPGTKLGMAINGKGWKSLSRGNSVGIKKPGMILQRSGQLASSISTYSDAATATVGTNKIYAAIHQFGGRTSPHVIRPKYKRALSFGGIVVRQVNHPGSSIPARPFLRMTPRDLRDIVETSREYATRAFARNGLRATD